MAMKVAIIPKYMIIKNGKSENKTIQNIFHCYTQAPMQKQEGKMLTATWGKHFFKADATKCASEIMEICDQMESATPQQILEKARDESTELHKCFTWDDSIAAEKYRIHEARLIVCQLKIVEQDIDNKSKPTAIRVFYKTDGKSGYKPTQLILKQPDEYEALLERCRNELLSVKQKYQNISEYEEVWELIN